MPQVIEQSLFLFLAILTGVILGQGDGAKAKKKKKKTALHDSEYVSLNSEDQVTDRSYDGAKSVNFYQGVPI